MAIEIQKGRLNLIDNLIFFTGTATPVGRTKTGPDLDGQVPRNRGQAS